MDRELLSITDSPAGFPMSRRDWLRRYFFGSVMAAGGSSAVLMELSAVAANSPARLQLKLADFPDLQPVGGSMQLVFSSIQPPLTINRVSAAEFAAVDSVCTHAACTVDKFSIASGCMECPCHGSQFDARGRVIGGPADADMNAFATSFDTASSTITIEVPGLGHDVRAISVHSRNAGITRLRLVFQVTAFATYEVRHQAQLGGSFVMIPFSTTATGVANQTTLIPNDDGQRTVYVDVSGQTGFFVLAIRLTPF
jgi:nitrite reductase/ring-hydroxylating ferredoxin subunit